MNRNSATQLTTALIGAALSILDDKSMPCEMALVPGKMTGKMKKATTFEMVPAKNGKPITDAAVLSIARAKVAEHVEAQNTRQGQKLVAKGFKVSLATEPSVAGEEDAPKKRTQRT